MQPHDHQSRSRLCAWPVNFKVPMVHLLYAAAFAGLQLNYLHNTDYTLSQCSWVDSQTKCKFCTNTEACTEDVEWDATTLT